MRVNLITDLLYHLDRKTSLKIDECGEVPAKYLEELALPTDLFCLLRWTWPTVSGEIGPYTIHPAMHVVEVVRDWPSLAENSMLPVGYARNGDFLVFRYAPDGAVEVGLLSHDDFWEKYEATPAQAYVRVTATVEEYLVRAAEGAYLPMDYYAARELEALRAEMSQTRG